MADQPPRIISRKRALVCLGMNVLGLPGLGTIMAGRAVGYVQAAVMSLGFFLAVGFMMWYLGSSVNAFKRFMITGVPEEIHYRPWLWVLWLGFALSAIAWTWSLVSSLIILRQTPPEDPQRIR